MECLKAVRRMLERGKNTLLIIAIILFGLLLVPSVVNAAPQTIIFDDKSGQNQNLTGQYPTGVINWGSSSWYHSGPWGLFTTKSVSFRSQNQTSGTFTLINPKKVVSFQSYNGGSVSSTVTVACSGNTTRSITAPVGQLVTLTTNWSNSCTTVTITSSNGWNTNFDNLVIDDAVTDTQAPTVSLTAPITGSTVSGSSVSVSANASDNVGVVGVQFKLDGNNLSAEDTSSPYSISWNTTNVSNGAHTLTAVARDAAGNQTSSSSVSINVDNPPKLFINQPVAGSTFESNGTVTINYTVSGDLAEANHAHFRLDGGTTKMDLDFDGSYTITDIAPGAHTLVGIIARSDHTEITGSEDTISFTTTAPDTTAPSVSITTPAPTDGQSGINVSGVVTVSANASDNVSVGGVQFKVDGNNISAEDTTAPYSINWDSTTVANGSHNLTATARDGSNNQTTSSVLVVNVNNVDPRAQVGQWSSLIGWPIVAVHGSLLDNGKVLLWDAWEYNSTEARLWDPVANTFTSVNVNSQLFCAGQAPLADGRILTTGGHNGGEIGIKDSFAYNPANSSWTQLPDMNFARWYPSNVRLGDGRMLTISGQITGGVWADTPEIYNPQTNSWTNVLVSTSDMHDTEYPLTFLQPNGQIYVIGATPGVTRILDLVNNTWTNAGSIPSKLGSAAMYRPGKVLYTGGGNIKDSGEVAKTQASVIDLNQATPSWRTVSSMNNPRYQHNLTVLPDGKVLAVGGANIVSQTTSAGTLTPEIFDPTTETWTNMANIATSRNYHSISILLPDGRVLSAGGGRLGGAPDRFNAQIYSPPYLFKGPRPTIANAPAITSYGQQIVVDSPDTQNIAKVSLIPLASVTHTLDMNQRYLEITFIKNGSQLQVNVPTNPNDAPVGYYMLFILNGDGVPSEGKFIKLVGDAVSPTISITNPVANSTILGSLTIDASASDNAGIASVQFLLDGNNLGSTDTTSPYSLSWDTKTVANGAHMLTARATDTSGNQTVATAINVTVDNPPDTTSPVISSVNSNNVVSNGATISWSTDENSDTQVEYGVDTNYGQTTTLNTNMVITHAQTLTGLTPNTTYHFRVKSKDPSGNIATSSDFTFTTLASNPQTITFNDATGQDITLNGQYPTGVINWGNNTWYLSAPWGLFTTKSVSFNGGGQTSGAFTFINPKRVTSVEAYNGGSVSSSVTLSCAGNTDKVTSVPVGQIVNITTNWTNSCTSVTISSSNGWNTNFDNLIIE